MKNLTSEELRAVERVAELMELDNNSIERYYNDDIISINKCRNGRLVAWGFMSESLQACVYVDTLQQLSEEEIDKELC